MIVSFFEFVGFVVVFLLGLFTLVLLLKLFEFGFWLLGNDDYLYEMVKTYKLKEKEPPFIFLKDKKKVEVRK